MLTGGEPIPVRHLHGKFWDLHPRFKAVGTCNEKPDIIGVDEGIWRRVMLVEWNVTIPLTERRKIDDVFREFDQERSGILNWLLDGLLRYLREGFVVPQDVLDATESYREDMDPVGTFLAACVYRGEEQKGKFVAARPLLDAYTAFSHHNALRPYKQKSFANILKGKGIEKIRRGGQIRYLDIELHDVPPDPDKPARGPVSNHVEFAEKPANHA